MNRKEFIKTCGTACLGVTAMSLLQHCKPAKQVQSVTSNNQLQINKSEFEVIHKEKKKFRRSIVTKPEHSDFPIVVYRFSDTEYSALLLRCTHQSSELNLNGDIMTCSAHGSEFNNKGEVIQGPAEEKLHAFKVTSDELKIYVHLS
ncbi:Rieske (2Fe-2S) iron-sulfur domain-containing protein [Sphingobacteriaceae bacterium]|nr:Rieske (2Fe-2S) iron-sulfur domain-containing protein [Sphingobacteriaceae bacterium]